MLELRILGPPDFRRSDGQPLTAELLGQSKRFALLAYLALEGQGGSARRDTVLALFWPELDQRHAAAALRQSLYVLRGVIGNETLIAQRQRLEVDVKHLWCDAIAFENDITAGRLEEGLALYRGPLLRGFHAAEVAPEFEQWLELRRIGFEQQAVQAASQLSRQSMERGDAEGAIRWARRGIDIDPLDEGLLRRLLVGLDAIGDRGAAVRAYDLFARELQEEMEIAPAAETQALLQAIRDRRDPAYIPALGQRSRPSASAGADEAGEPTVLEEPGAVTEEGDQDQRRRKIIAAAAVAVLGSITALSFLDLGRPPDESLVGAGVLKHGQVVLLADFESPSADTVLADVVTEAIRVDLSQSRTFHLMEPARVRAALKRMERGSAGPFDLELASEVAVREGISAVIGGEVARVGGSFVLSARLVSPDSGGALVAVRQTAADSSDIIPAIDRLSANLREGIGESLRSIRSSEPLARVTTSSLAALEKYSRASRVIRSTGDYPRAAELYEEAIVIDPDFAMAYQALASALYNTGRQNRGRQMEALNKAYSLRDRLTEPERLHVTGLYHAWRGEQRKSAAAFQDLIEIQPDNRGAISNTGTAFAHMRQYDRDEQFQRRAIAADPTHSSSYWNLTRALLNQGKLEDAESVTRRMRQLFPDEPRLELAWVGLHAARGEHEAAAAKLDALRAPLDRDPLWDANVTRMLAHLRALQGRPDEAKRAWSDAMDIYEQNGEATEYLRTAIELAEFELLVEGDTLAALERVERASERFPLSELDQFSRPYLPLGWIYALAGRPDRARALLHERQAELPATVLRSEEHHWRLVKGAVALAEGDPREAIVELHRADAGQCPVCTLPLQIRAYDALGIPDSTRVIARRYLSVPWAERAAAVWWHPFLDVLGGGDAYWRELIAERVLASDRDPTAGAVAGAGRAE